MLLKIKWNEAHHLYWGVAMAIIFGWLEMPILCAIGVLIALDDLYQHYKQVEFPNYHSPIHQWYVRHLYKYRFVQWLNLIADNLLRGK